MNIAIIHFHLNRGGVTQVVLNHLRALSEVADQFGPCRVAILFGGRKEDWPADISTRLPGVTLSLHVVPELEYDGRPDTKPRPDSLTQQLGDALRRLGFSPGNALLHIHNHALGKNVSLPGAVTALARDGYSLVLQIHDFAEDFRPDNYRRLSTSLGGADPDAFYGTLYPQAPQIHYAVLNGRDGNILRSAGVSDSVLHGLPNPVAEFRELPTREQAKAKLRDQHGAAAEGQLVLYPVRGIRRKNVGEMLLCAAVADSNTVFGITQPPLNPTESTSYERWKRLAADLSLPCLFDMGRVAGVTFADNVAAADAVITTSVAEGFGMVFLEAWLAGRFLVGRDIPEITSDFVGVGLRLPALYDRLQIPLSWLGREAFAESMLTIYGQVLSSFGRPLATSAQIASEVEGLIAGGTVDFACLDSSLQESVIRRVHEDVASRGILRDSNPQLARHLDVNDGATRQAIDENADVVRRSFSLQSAGRRLHQLYRSASESPRSDHIHAPPNGESVLASFLSLSRFHPLRVET